MTKSEGSREEGRLSRMKAMAEKHSQRSHTTFEPKRYGKPKRNLLAMVPKKREHSC